MSKHRLFDARRDDKLHMVMRGHWPGHYLYHGQIWFLLSAIRYDDETSLQSLSDPQ